VTAVHKLREDERKLKEKLEREQKAESARIASETLAKERHSERKKNDFRELVKLFLLTWIAFIAIFGPLSYWDATDFEEWNLFVIYFMLFAAGAVSWAYASVAVDSLIYYVSETTFQRRHKQVVMYIKSSSEFFFLSLTLIVLPFYVWTFLIIPNPTMWTCLSEECVLIALEQREERDLLAAENEQRRAQEKRIADQQRAQERRIADQQRAQRIEQRLGKNHISDALIINYLEWELVYATETEIQQDRKESDYKGKYVYIQGLIYDIDERSEDKFFVQLMPPGPTNFRSLVINANCTANTDEEKELLYSKQQGDYVTVVGEFRSYGDMTGLGMDSCSVIR